MALPQKKKKKNSPYFGNGIATIGFDQQEFQ